MVTSLERLAYLRGVVSNDRGQSQALTLDGFLGERRRANRGAATRLRREIASHFWTIAPALRAAITAAPEMSARPFQAIVKDEALGGVRISGLLSDAPASDTVVIILHGIGGDAHSPCCLAAARTVAQAGHASLRLSMRGADLSGEDIYHGGLTADLRAALASPELRRFRHVMLIGYSVGGHLALRAAIEQIDPRLRAAAAICPPLDLMAGAVAFDEPRRWLYRRYVFAGMNRGYAAVAARRPVAVPLAVVKRARSAFERDELTVIPRFGFASARDYYLRAGVAPVIDQLAIPSLVVASLHDPVVPPHTLRAAVADASAALKLRWVDGGGHIFFPPSVDLGFGGRPGVEHQVVNWLSRQ
ncbi:MAG: alpha/beta fold hydrolase [Blastocatellia bacterium]